MSDGAKIELVSRGAKDAFFTNAEARRTWFGAPYERRSPSTREIRLVYPETGARFGQWVDIELPTSSDILMRADIRIRMPTWLPPQIAALNATHSVQVESATWPGSFLAYGWTSGIANYLIQRWALFADNVMIVDGYGDFNSWFPDMETTHPHAPLIHASTGTHDGTNGNIQKNAVLPELVFSLPIVGCQSTLDTGLPLCALHGYQRLYIRLWLADKSKLVESGLYGTAATDDPERVLDLYEPCPAPWGGRRIKVDGVLSDLVTLKDYEVGQPYIYARYAVLNLDDEMRAALRSIPHAITFRQELRQDFTIEDEDWNPSALFKQELEIHGLFQTLFVGIISNARRQQNKYRDINPPGNPANLSSSLVAERLDWLINLGLIVNGVERISFWPPKKFQVLANNTQMRRDVEAQLYSLVFGINPDTEPAGPCNLSRTQKVILSMQLNDVYKDPMAADRQSFASVLGLSWNVFQIRDGRCSLLYSD